jgi:cell division protein FtsB
MGERLYTSRLWVSVILSLGAIILGVGMVRGESSISNYMDLHRSEKVLEKTVANLQNSNAELNLEIHKIKESSSYAKKVLRDKYHVTESGEKIVFYGE